MQQPRLAQVRRSRLQRLHPQVRRSVFNLKLEFCPILNGSLVQQQKLEQIQPRVLRLRRRPLRVSRSLYQCDLSCDVPTPCRLLILATSTSTSMSTSTGTFSSTGMFLSTTRHVFMCIIIPILSYRRSHRTRLDFVWVDCDIYFCRYAVFLNESSFWRAPLPSCFSQPPHLARPRQWQLVRRRPPVCFFCVHISLGTPKPVPS